MTAWLLETLVWTAVLIAAVLMVRRSVARWFGPQIAYALWAIPALRLVLPPIELPAWMRPSAPADSAPLPMPVNTGGTPIESLGNSAPVATTNGPAATEAAAAIVPAPITPGTSFEFGSFTEPMIELAVAVWLIGVAIFLYLRFAAYFRLRADMLKNSSDVGRDGGVRLVETSGTDAPIAFGVIDKVIALPRGFLAQPDQTARDLALAHEMQHHRGHDLLINVMVQPLFALHWFNPLCRYGWLALRRDQEAACDARVIAAKSAKTRKAYANLIVRTAAGPALAPKLALAAPMACPVLGEKSIIHRLRSLNMTDTSKKRRMAGRLMLGAAVIALPLTASISYAASEPSSPPLSPAAPVAPIAPIAPGSGGAGASGGAAPMPPVPPVPMAISNVGAITAIDPDTGAPAEIREEQTVVIIRGNNGNIGEERTVYRTRAGEQLSEERMEEIMAEVREGLEEANQAMAELPMIIERSLRVAENAEGRTIVKMECDNSSDEPATTTENADGSRTVMICQTRIMASALEGLREAREEISQSRDMSAQMRDRIVRQLDEQIASWQAAQS